ncbi:hypothetical protein ACFQFQ_07895 [Sulfitobacter porphyrae]|uniref:Uncharacterized protein n=1 Tax=Sulfitobacter porphyrae TaxID=1246864 RepID=A0ABW2B188_9RHOB
MKKAAVSRSFQAIGTFNRAGQKMKSVPSRSPRLTPSRRMELLSPASISTLRPICWT